MYTINVGKKFGYTQISKNNNKAYECLLDEINSVDENELIMLDFDSVDLKEPWLNDSFKKLLSIERVHMKIYCNEELKNTIELLCKIGNLKTGRIINEDIYVEDESMEIVEEKPSALSIKLYNGFEIEDDVAILEIYNIISQIGSEDTVKALKYAIQKINKDKDINKFVIKTADIFIQVSMINILSIVLYEFDKNGIDVVILSDDIDTSNKFGMYRIMNGRKEISSIDKIKIFENNVNINTVGMLSKFKATRRKDEFGRCGDGKPISCRPAIFKGMFKKNDKYYLKFREYYTDSFITRIEYASEHDNENIDELPYKNTVIEIDELGFSDRFIGSLYHFNLPIQFSKDGYIDSYYLNEDGNMKRVKKTLPNRIMEVLNDYGIEYDKMSLIFSIGESEKYLSRESMGYDKEKNE